jgi:hypothetical protein
MKKNSNKVYAILMLISWLVLIFCASSLEFKGESSSFDKFEWILESIEIVTFMGIFGLFCGWAKKGGLERILKRYCPGMWKLLVEEAEYEDDIFDTEKENNKYGKISFEARTEYAGKGKWKKDKNRKKGKWLLRLSLVANIALLALGVILCAGRDCGSDFVENGRMLVCNDIFRELCMTVIFPVFVFFILRKLREQNFSTEAVVSGSIQIVLLTVTQFLIFSDLSKISIMEMVIVNIFSLVLEVACVIWKNVKKKGLLLTGLAGYSIASVLAVVVAKNLGHTMADIWAESGIPDNQNSIWYSIIKSKLFDNISVFSGISDKAIGSEAANLLKYITNPILNAMYYGGWILGVVVILLEIIFIVSTWRLLRVGDRRLKILDTIAYAQWFWISIRFLAGTLTTFCLPTLIQIPFSSYGGILIDNAALGCIIFVILYRRQTKITANIHLVEDDD